MKRVGGRGEERERARAWWASLYRNSAKRHGATARISILPRNDFTNKDYRIGYVDAVRRNKYSRESHRLRAP